MCVRWFWFVIINIFQVMGYKLGIVMQDMQELSFLKRVTLMILLTVWSHAVQAHYLTNNNVPLRAFLHLFGFL